MTEYSAMLLDADGAVIVMETDIPSFNLAKKQARTFFSDKEFRAAGGVCAEVWSASMCEYQLKA